MQEVVFRECVSALSPSRLRYDEMRQAVRFQQGRFIGPILCMSLLGAFPLRADQSIVIRSGNGTVGTQDAQVRFLAYGRTGNVTPTAQNFVSVETGSFAHVVSPYATYVQHLPSDPLARWIATTSTLSPGSALYAIPFVVTDSVIAAASLDLGYAVDNAVNGVYINGIPISGNSDDGDYHGEYYFLRSDIGPLLRPNSTNWLYLNVTDNGVLSALICSATITTQGIVQTPSISPAVGGNTGPVTVQVIASGVQPGAQLSLTGTGSPIVGTAPVVVGPNILTATLNLANAPPGVRTVIVANPTGPSIVLPNAFTIEQGGSSTLQIQKVGTPAVLGRNETFFITITNTGLTDAGLTPIVEVLEPWFTFVAATPTQTSLQTASAYFPPGSVGTNYTSSVEWDLPNMPSGASIVLSYTVLVDKNVPVTATVEGPACINKVRVACYSALSGCLGILDQEPLKTLCEIPPVPVGCLFDRVANCYAQFFFCASIGEDWCAIYRSRVRGSVDPNDLSVPGYGDQGWIRGAVPMQYALSFENLPSATKAASTVAITDTFDSLTLDPSTLFIGSVAFGDSVYRPPTQPLAANPFSADIDLRPAQSLIVRVTAALNPTTNQTTVNFFSLDPTTGLPPADPLVGFLPPGVGGAVVFAIMPKSALATGTTIQDTGTVVFDVNPPINTPTALSTIDITPPKSQVSALPATTSCPSFPVNWSGSDVGSGIRSFDIFVSDSGGAFQPWLQNDTLTSAVYQGSVGHEYSFYSLAQDNVGNVEASKTAAESSTSVIAAGPCGPPALAIRVTDSVLTGNTLIVSLQLINNSVSNASTVSIDSITVRPMIGVGTVVVDTPAVPVSVGPLVVGGSQGLTLTLSVPSSVSSFSLTESGTLSDAEGNGFSYAIAEPIVPASGIGCDINNDMATDVLDVQGILNETLGIALPVNDLNQDGVVNVTDVQIVINAVLNLNCTA